MFSFFIALHVIVCSGLIFLVLVQRGRGGGLIESFSSAENALGTKTSSFLVKATTTLAIAFFINCLILAFLTIQKNKSKMSKFPVQQPVAADIQKEVDKALEETDKESSEAQQKAQEIAPKTQPQQAIEEVVQKVEDITQKEDATKESLPTK